MKIMFRLAPVLWRYQCRLRSAALACEGLLLRLLAPRPELPAFCQLEEVLSPHLSSKGLPVGHLSWAPSSYMVNTRYIRIQDSESMFRAHGMDCRRAVVPEPLATLLLDPYYEQGTIPLKISLLLYDCKAYTDSAIYKCIHIHLNMHMHIHMHTRMCICMYIYIYTYIHIIYLSGRA